MLVANFLWPGIERKRCSSTLPAALRNEISGLESVAAFYSYSANITVPGEDKKPANLIQE